MLRREAALSYGAGDLQAQFSLAYVQAVASRAGFFVQNADRGFDKNGAASLSKATARGASLMGREEAQRKLISIVDAAADI